MGQGNHRRAAPSEGYYQFLMYGRLCPSMRYIRRPARLGAAGPSDLAALQNSHEVHTLRVATARNRSTPRVWLACLRLWAETPVAPSRSPKPLSGRGSLLPRTSQNSSSTHSVNTALDLFLWPYQTFSRPG